MYEIECEIETCYVSILDKWKLTRKREVNQMFNLSIDQAVVEKAIQAEISKRVEDFAIRSVLIEAKVAQEMASLSWPTMLKLWGARKDFKECYIRVGTKYLFDKKMYEEFLTKWKREVTDQGGYVDLKNA